MNYVKFEECFHVGPVFVTGCFSVSGAWHGQPPDPQNYLSVLKEGQFVADFSSGSLY